MSRSQAYHDETKYRPETIAAHPGLDWDSKPATTKCFHSEDRIDLRPHLALTRDDESQLPCLTSDLAEGDIDLRRLSTFLLHVYGVTAIANDGNNEHTFRAAPSAGALYPNEIYLALRDIEGLTDGIYNYQVIDHALVPVCEGDFQGDLRHNFFDATATRARCIVLVTAIFFRSAWRYHDRGYRRVLLDTGHLLGNAYSIAPYLSLQICALPSFNDAGLASLLWLNDEEEAVVAAFALDDLNTDGLRAPGAAASETVESDQPKVCPEALHRGGYLATLTTSRDAVTPPAAPLGFEDLPSKTLRPEPLDWPSRICGTILMRRSAREFTGATISRGALGTILAHSYTDWSGAETAFHAPTALRTLIAIHGVENLTPGLYEYEPATGAVHLWRAGNFASQCCQIALGQEIALHCAAMVVHTANLDRVDASFGDRGYRYLGLDAGLLGQRMNLTAEALGLGACGIGGYFDDQVNELFKLPAGESVLYLTCLGVKGQD